VPEKITILDTTLRDGAQTPGVSFSVEDKLALVGTLDALGVDIIEAGHPASNPKDAAFFRKAGALTLGHARLAAFGATRRKDKTAAEDEQLAALLAAETPVAVVFGKARLSDVRAVLGCTSAENLAMIEETAAFLKAHGREVVFDAEHFFDGYREDAAYALEALRAALRGGAASLALCDTSGGGSPDEVYDTVRATARAVDAPLGIHCHNDGGMAAANTILAVKAGARQAQGTLVGLGERCGNAALTTVIPHLQLKLGFACLPDLTALTHAARRAAEIANLPLPEQMPYVGAGAFAHKAGMHIDGVLKKPDTFEHIDPAAVGNRRRLLTSEVGGRMGLLGLMRALDPTLDKDSPALADALRRLKDKEHEGYQYEGAEGSLALLLRRALGRYRPFFELIHFKTIGEQTQGAPATAVVKIRVGDRQEVTAAEGEGPVHALDRALRRALEVFYPQLGGVRLIDYKVRVLEAGDATAARVRVLLTSTDGRDVWTTTGVSADIIQASFQALVDSMEYRLTEDK
jgi:2-isopropylmalate synthase